MTARSHRALSRATIRDIPRPIVNTHNPHNRSDQGIQPLYTSTPVYHHRDKSRKTARDNARSQRA